MERIVVDNTGVQQRSEEMGWQKNRQMFYAMPGLYEYDVSIIVIACDRLEEKTKHCVDSILNYTTGYSFQLILVDSGSTDGTCEYFESVQCKNKVVIRIEKNLGQGYARQVAAPYERGKYLAFVANDCIVTARWLENLIACMESDVRIGMVCPGMSHVTNHQEVDIGVYNSWEEMQKLAEEYNHSDPKKWEERPRLIDPVAIYRAEVFDWIENFDPGFRHNFNEDNRARSLHRCGYKMVHCGDTFVAHNHPDSERDMSVFGDTLKEGRACFVEKYHLDPWDDFNNYVFPYIADMDLEGRESVSVLGVNIRSGTPFFDIRNKARVDGVKDVTLFAYTSDLRYYSDLSAFPAEVRSGDIDRIDHAYEGKEYDVVVTTEDINGNDDPGNYLNKLTEIVKKGGYLIFPLKNREDILYFIDQMLGEDNQDEGFSQKITYDGVLRILEKAGAENVWINEERYQERLKETLMQGAGVSIFDYIAEHSSVEIDQVFVEKYWFLVRIV